MSLRIQPPEIFAGSALSTGTAVASYIMGVPGFAMAYQPLVDLQTGRVTHFEALLRPPMGARFGSVEDYIRTAERTGFVVPMDLDTTGYVADVISAAHFVKRPQVAVNLSGRSLDTDSFRSKLSGRARAWARSGTTPLRFEVTETHRIRDLSAARGTLAHLRQLGFPVAIDDVGKHPEDDLYLKGLSFDEVKIDGAVVREATTTGGHRALRKLIARLRPYNATIVAEMIDDPRLVKILLDLGVHQGQGFLFAKPTTDIAMLERQGEVLWP